MSSLLLALLACVPPADPLFHHRQALAQLAPLDTDWAAQAALALDPDLVSGWIAESVAAELRDLPSTMTLPGGLFGDLEVVQSLTVDPVEVASVGGVLHVATPVRGRVEVELHTLLGSAVETLDWTGTVLCAFALALEGQDVVARPHEPERWGLELVLGERSDTVDATLGVLLEEALRMSLAVSPPDPRVLAELPDQSVRALRLRPGADALVVDFAFHVLDPGTVGAVPHPGGGFVAVLPEQTALALARAAVLSEPATPEAIEPTSLRLEGDTFELGVRQHLASGVKPRRFYTLTGTLALERGALVATPVSLQALGGAVRTRLSDDHRLRLLADLTRALTVSLPARSTAWVAGEDRPIEAVRLETLERQLVVWGEVGETGL